ncbi:MAG: AAA family ATPase [Hormoscilla sp. SP12CHS1]|nr:AAA family ATPase [Hormoscilla sp. SP12CHS1]
MSEASCCEPIERWFAFDNLTLDLLSWIYPAYIDQIRIMPSELHLPQGLPRNKIEIQQPELSVGETVKRSVPTITSLTIEGFKTLEKVNINLSNFNLLLGRNASGKSNFLEALRVLQGIGYGLTIDEIFNGKPKSTHSEVWEPIRGGSSKANFAGGSNGDRQAQVIRFSVTLKSSSEPEDVEIQYSLDISTELGSIQREKLQVGDTLIFDVRPDKSRSMLHQLLLETSCDPKNAHYIKACIRTLSNMQHLTPSPAILRNYSQTRTAKRMGDRGENFAALVQTIIAESTEKSAFLSWLKEFMPSGIDDICILSGALGEPLFALKEGDINYPAPILSDGILRFAAITAAFFQPDPPALLIIEEVEHSIHPNSLRVLVELLKNLSMPIQVIATTHSPLLLDWLRQEDYPTTFACKRDEETGATRIVPFKEIPKLLKIVEKYPIGELFAEGWFDGGVI